MRIILAGAPGSGKSKILQQLPEELIAAPDRADGEERLQTGDLADYRTELAIAVSRVEQEDGVAKHSLLDSVAHTAVRLDRMIRNKSVSDKELGRWIATAQLVVMLLQDSFKYDKVFFIPGNDGTEFAEQIEIALKALLEESQTNYTLTSVDKAAKLVKEQVGEDGQERDSTKLNAEALTG